MSNNKIILLFALLCSSITIAAPTSSLNEMYSCHGLVTFVDSKILGTKTYSNKEKAVIRRGLSSYLTHLDDKLITPQLMTLYSGNVSQVNLMKQIFERQQKNFSKHLNARYSEKKIARDYLSAIQECERKTESRSSFLQQAISIMEKH
ncbi:hypothetical protein OFY17_03575 [Marinomonas sp. C2222]|uniref:Uncharacterized protein n=1 Tax=Marinomonas sargassi TaxID=2984494 RepID=A0ABT2YQE1_9GAMM|nr:hypothetical protein [Marinomonas sargassi]MCV2401960.1 hypothetical protein [Marinomonas sargassi]